MAPPLLLDSGPLYQAQGRNEAQIAEQTLLIPAPPSNMARPPRRNSFWGTELEQTAEDILREGRDGALIPIALSTSPMAPDHDMSTTSRAHRWIPRQRTAREAQDTEQNQRPVSNAPLASTSSQHLGELLYAQGVRRDRYEALGGHQEQQQAQASLLDQPTSNMPSLRSQGEFYMTAVTPVDTTSEPLPDDAECTICLEPLIEDVVRFHACRHMFHTVCVLSWFDESAPRNGRQRGTCPNCRHELYEPDPQFGAVRPAPITNRSTYDVRILTGTTIQNTRIQVTENTREHQQAAAVPDLDGEVEDPLSSSRPPHVNHFRRESGRAEVPRTMGSTSPPNRDSPSSFIDLPLGFPVRESRAVLAARAIAERRPLNQDLDLSSESSSDDDNEAILARGFYVRPGGRRTEQLDAYRAPSNGINTPMFWDPVTQADGAPSALGGPRVQLPALNSFTPSSDRSFVRLPQQEVDQDLREREQYLQDRARAREERMLIRRGISRGSTARLEDEVSRLTGHLARLQERLARHRPYAAAQAGSLPRARQPSSPSLLERPGSSDTIGQLERTNEEHSQFFSSLTTQGERSAEQEQAATSIPPAPEPTSQELRAFFSNLREQNREPHPSRSNSDTSAEHNTPPSLRLYANTLQTRVLIPPELPAGQNLGGLPINDFAWFTGP
ncbi:hypothetical protein EJ02DRAFT_419024 [Clathrospora elynae]|uniref:RING-type domain-containing protein n=1 Tax=Clathrospora elynae TaxID=706981 RepID=A0A6A5T5A8_9PLEO|nr:hypothetical protein EJ02DRAFT_419024 [Clathrospora elynae]